MGQIVEAVGYAATAQSRSKAKFIEAYVSNAILAATEHGIKVSDSDSMRTVMDAARSTALADWNAMIAQEQANADAAAADAIESVKQTPADAAPVEPAAPDAPQV